MPSSISQAYEPITKKFNNFINEDMDDRYAHIGGRSAQKELKPSNDSGNQIRTQYSNYSQQSYIDKVKSS